MMCDEQHQSIEKDCQGFEISLNQSIQFNYDFVLHKRTVKSKFKINE